MAHVDPAQRRDRDQVVAEVAEYVDSGPVVERVCIVVASSIYNAVIHNDVSLSYKYINVGLGTILTDKLTVAFKVSDFELTKISFKSPGMSLLYICPFLQVNS